MGEGRLIAADLVIERRQRLAVEGERRAVVERPAAEGQQRARRVVCRHRRDREPQLVLSETGGERPFDSNGTDFLADPAVDCRRTRTSLPPPLERSLPKPPSTQLFSPSRATSLTSPMSWRLPGANRLKSDAVAGDAQKHSAHATEAALPRRRRLPTPAMRLG